MFTKQNCSIQICFEKKLIETFIVDKPTANPCFCVSVSFKYQVIKSNTLQQYNEGQTLILHKLHFINRMTIL